MGEIPEFLHGRVEYKSDVDGDRYAIIDHRLVDMTGWKVEVRTIPLADDSWEWMDDLPDDQLEESGTPIREFNRETTWWGGDPGTSWSGLGFGEPMQPWSVWCDHGERIVRWIPPEDDQ